ncbi:MAG: RNA polymerase sigma factor [Planctomycetaceae bacterium]
MITPTDEQSLQTRFNDRDVTVLDDIHRAYFPILCGRAMSDRVVNKRFIRGLALKEDAEDVAQEAFAALVKQIVVGHPNFPAWLNKVTDNKCRNHLRKCRNRRRSQGYRETVSLDAPPSGDPARASMGSKIRGSVPSAPEQLERTELRQIVMSCVEALPQETQAIVWMRFGLDFGFQRIADTLELPLGTVNSRWQREDYGALHKLRDCIQRKLSQHKADWLDLRRELGLANQ